MALDHVFVSLKLSERDSKTVREPCLNRGCLSSVFAGWSVYRLLESQHIRKLCLVECHNNTSGLYFFV